MARAAAKAIYARKAKTVARTDDHLSPGLAAALRALVQILLTVKPRFFVPFYAEHMEMAVLYADAFFTDGEKKQKAGHVPDGLNPMPS